MKFPLVRDLAVEGVPAAVTCRILTFSKQDYFKQLKNPVTERDRANSYLTNQVLDIHHHDPGFGYRFITDELNTEKVVASENRVQRVCALHATKRGLSRRPGPKVHDDLVKREFSATGMNELWLADITGHPTAEGKLDLCAVKDVFANRIFGYSIDKRMRAELAVRAPENALASRRTVVTVVQSNRGSQAVPRDDVRPRASPQPFAGIHGSSGCLRRQRRDGVVLRAAAEERL
jgi:transposase InsO family protein